MNLKITASTVICAAALFSTQAFAGDTADQKADATVEKAKTPTPLDLLTIDETYIGASTVRGNLSFAKQDEFHTSVDYSHRFHVVDNWYLRLGLAYERYDFGKSLFPLPNRLQAASATIAYEYVIEGFAGAAIELHPGFYYENDISKRNFDVPIDVYTGFKIKDDKVFGMIGFFEGQFLKPSIIPIVGVIWLINDKTRLEAIFPHSALVYTLNENWELRANAEVNGYGFRMDDNGRTPATYKGAAMQYFYYQVGGKVTYSGWKPFNVSLGAGYSIQREFDFFRYDYNEKYKAAGAPYVQLTFEAKF